MKNKLSALCLSCGLGMIVIAAIGIFALRESTPNAAAQSASLDHVGVAPDWTLKSLDGKDVKLSDFKGKVVLMNFWATWCPPCRQEMPGLVKIQDKLKGKDFTVIGISMDEGTAPVTKFVAASKLNFPIVMGTPDVISPYGGDAIPLTILIDRKGNAVKSFVGARSEAEFEAAIEPLL